MLRFLFLMIFFVSASAEARQVNAVMNGDWGDAATWDVGVPTCGDTILISAPITVSVNAQTTYGCASIVRIQVYGILQFTNGNKLSLPCGSIVEVMAGGTIKKATAGGGNSTFIEICNATVWNAAVGPIGGYTLLPNNATLPVNWLFLEATRKEDTVILNWSTASESNNDYFTVESCTDRNLFIPLGNVDGIGFSTALTNYSFTDRVPSNGITYYRIKQTDFDGKTTTSSIVAVAAVKSNLFELLNVYYNSSQLEVVYNLLEPQSCNWKVIDVSGRILYKGKLQPSNGLMTIQLQCLSTESSGIYRFEISNGNQLLMKRFFKE